MSERYRVLVADDSAFAVRPIRKALAGSEFEIVDEARDGMQAIEKYRQVHPDLVLLDVVMPGMNALDVIAGLLTVDPQAVIVMQSSFAAEGTILECLAAGAKDFVQKAKEPKDFLRRLQEAVAGDEEEDRAT